MGSSDSSSSSSAVSIRLPSQWYSPALSNTNGWRIFNHCPTASAYGNGRPVQIVIGGMAESSMLCSFSSRIELIALQVGVLKGNEIQPSRSVTNSLIIRKGG